MNPLSDAPIGTHTTSTHHAQHNPRAARYIRLIAIVSTFGGLLFGYDTGVINGALIYMMRDLGLTPLTEGLVTSSLLLGAAVGAVLGGRLSDRNGRRKNIMFLAFLFLVGALACALAPNIPAMVLSRFMLGLAVGGASVSVPTYLAEMSPAKQRGRMVTQNELMIVSGQLLAYASNAIIGNLWGEQHGVWRWMLALAALPAIALWLGMLIVPESPRWLASQGRFREALRVLRTVRHEHEADVEFKGIRHVAERHATAGRGGWGDLSTPWIRRIFLIGVGLAVVQQATGVNSIMYYGTQILAVSGFGKETALLANIANGVISIAATLLGIRLLGKIGRRPMLLTGLSGTTLSLLFIGLLSSLLGVSELRAYLVLAAMTLFLAFMQGFVAPVTWVMLSEIFPMRIRGFAIGFAGSVLWMVNFAIGLGFPSLVAYTGISTTFFVFFSFGLFAIAFVKWFLPETRGRSLEAIEAELRTMHEGV
ncbi:sugar porter family MFS transporter [Paraburkholderia sediminicola]|uniref:sugar porter family MFS transporter n=1 Tax=Paraburkholderia sediminicola TaxID=458836 RepID=UPI0038BA0E71